MSVTIAFSLNPNANVGVSGFVQQCQHRFPCLRARGCWVADYSPSAASCAAAANRPDSNNPFDNPADAVRPPDRNGDRINAFVFLHRDGAVALTLDAPAFAQFSPGPNPVTTIVGAQTLSTGTGTVSSGGKISTSARPWLSP